MKLDDNEYRDSFVEAEVYQRIAVSIIDLRKQRGWSQEELAKRLGTKQPVISRLENPDNERVSVSTLLRLSHVFDVPLLVQFPSWPDWKARTENYSRESIEQQPYPA